MRSRVESLHAIALRQRQMQYLYLRGDSIPVCAIVPYEMVALLDLSAEPIFHAKRAVTGGETVFRLHPYIPSYLKLSSTYFEHDTLRGIGNAIL